MIRGAYALGQAVIGEMPDWLKPELRTNLRLAYIVIEGFTIAIIIGVLLTLGRGDHSVLGKEVDAHLQPDIEPTIGDSKQNLPPNSQAFPRTPEELYQYALQVDGITQQQKYGQGPFRSA